MKERLYFYYDLLFSVLALIAVYLSICDIFVGYTPFQKDVDSIITVLFVADYGIRLLLAKSKKDFFLGNVLDLIAIIPFNSLFKAFRIFKMLKVLKLLKFARVSAYFVRFYRRVKFFFEINGLKYMVVACLVCIVLGGFGIHFVEGMNLFDGLWWSFVTATTVGYGDISPATPAGRVIAAILMLVGIGLIGSLTSSITALFFQRNSGQTEAHSARNELVRNIQTQLDSFEDLTDEDIEVICRTLKTLHKN